MIEIRYVEREDRQFWQRLDRHLPDGEFEDKMRRKRGYVILKDHVPVGLLRYNLFWDQIPFCTYAVYRCAFSGERAWEKNDGILGNGYETAGTWHGFDFHADR